MADNLDDSWWQGNSSEQKVSDEEEHSQEIKGDTKPKHKKAKKRKLKEVNDTCNQEQPDEEEKPAPKKKKRKRRTITEELKTKGIIYGKPSDLISLVRTHFEGQLSSVEWDGLTLEEKHFSECSDLGHTSLSYLRTILPKWKKMVQSANLEPGSPLVLILTAAAIRCVDLNREINDFKIEGCKSAKLFGKHMKVEKQRKFLKENICHLGVGTPQRVMALIKLGALKIDNLSAVVIDWNWRDIKQRRLIDSHESKSDLLLLLKDYLIPHIRNNRCKIGFL